MTEVNSRVNQAELDHTQISLSEDVTIMNQIYALLPFFRYLVLCLVIYPATSHAYIGPGAGLSAIGALIAVVAAVALAIFGFVWYPIKRLIRKRRQENRQQLDPGEEQKK